MLSTSGAVSQPGGWHGQVLLPVSSQPKTTGKSTCPCHPEASGTAMLPTRTVSNPTRILRRERLVLGRLLRVRGDAPYPRADPAQDLVGNRVRPLRQVVHAGRGKRVVVQQRNLFAHRGVRVVGQVNRREIHADPPDDRRRLALHDYPASI